MKHNSVNHDDWMLPELKRSNQKAWRVFFICAVAVFGLAVGYLCTLNIIFNWIAMIPAGVALFCLGYQDAMVRADNYIRDYASQVALIIETKITGKGGR